MQYRAVLVTGETDEIVAEGAPTPEEALVSGVRYAESEGLLARDGRSSYTLQVEPYRILRVADRGEWGRLSDVERTDRATIGGLIMNAYAVQHPGDCATKMSAGDWAASLIADILHYIAADGHDVRRVLDQADAHYRTESGE